MMRWSVAFAFLVLTGACAHQPSASCGGDALRLAQASPVMRAPFEIMDGRIYVQAHVNGAGPYRFMFDTGASGMGRADVRLVQELSLSRVPAQTATV